MKNNDYSTFLSVLSIDRLAEISLKCTSLITEASHYGTDPSRVYNTLDEIFNLSRELRSIYIKESKIHIGLYFRFLKVGSNLPF